MIRSPVTSNSSRARPRRLQVKRENIYLFGKKNKETSLKTGFAENSLAAPKI